MAGEFELIDRYFTRATRREDVALGIGDDCALLRVAAGDELAISIDTLIEGVHFPSGSDASDIGHKSLAVGLSDLAAMGAEPAWATLSLSLPHADPKWLASFMSGFGQLADRHAVELVGGDTVRGPLVITVQVHGFVVAGRALRRDGAGPGDLVCVSGSLGGAAMALQQIQAGANVNARLRERLDRPQPRVELGMVLRDLASACIDLSDGLVSDLRHILDRSHCGAELYADRLPLEPARPDSIDALEAMRLALSGGDDYELCFCIPATSLDTLPGLIERAGCQLSVVGRITDGRELRLLRSVDGPVMAIDTAGYDHFADRTRS